MNIGNQSVLYSRVKIDGGGSSTVFASATGSRWVLQNAVIGWANMLNSATISLYEFNATNSTQFFQFMVSATSGIQGIYFGELGCQASSSYSSRLVFNTASVAGTVCGVFSGFQTGG